MRSASRLYHRRPIDCWTIRAGETDGGGDDIEMPVAGLMIGIALRARVAAGWWSFRPEWWLWNVGGTKGGDDELSEKGGAMVVGCWVGDPWGELLASDDRSDAELAMEATFEGWVSPSPPACRGAIAKACMGNSHRIR